MGIYKNNELSKLCEVPIGSNVKLKVLLSEGLIRRRMMDLGLVPDTIIQVVRSSPFGDPTAYLIKGAQIALRKEEASQVLVQVLKNV